VGWLDKNKVQDCRAELAQLEDAIQVRSAALLEKVPWEAPTAPTELPPMEGQEDGPTELPPVEGQEGGPTELPPVEGQEGGPTVFGIDLILEVCKTSISELPQEAQDNIERIVGSTSEICMYKILSELDRVPK